MKKLLTASTVLALTLTTTACGRNSGEEPFVAKPRRYSDSQEIKDQLAASGWNCVRWKDVETDARCGFEKHPGDHAIFITNDPELQAAMNFDYNADSKSVVIGENWVFDCGDPQYFSSDKCSEIAKALGGEVKQRG